MALPVIVKSTKRGIQLVLDPEIPYELLKEKIREKFKDTKEFFRDASFAVCFLGRVITEHQTKELLDIIMESSNANILCVLEENELLDTYIAEKLNLMNQEKTLRCGQFHTGNIYAGQTLECEHSVVILGDVRKGAKIISKGNIVVLGALEGYAFAGASGMKHAFIAALQINAARIKIADYSLGKRKLGKTDLQGMIHVNSPQIAKTKDKMIVIEPLTDGFLYDI